MIAKPQRFEFFQAVRLWLQIARRERRDSGRSPGTPVAGPGLPRDDLVRFRALNSLTFPGVEVQALLVRDVSDAQGGSTVDPADAAVLRAEMVVTFLGLTGPNGALPRHYTQLILDRMQRKDHALREFLDLFNHRIISAFYAAGEKYRFPVGIESADARGADEELLFKRCLFCLIGLSDDGASRARRGVMRERSAFPDESLLYYGGFFAHSPRNVTSLVALIEDYWSFPAHIEQFRGQWLQLPGDSQTRLVDDLDPSQSVPRLGVDVVVGERVWSVEQCFRVRLGPLSLADFMRFTPLGDLLVPLGQMIRQYVGPEFDFEIQPVLRAEEVPACQLTDDDLAGTRLGWNTWLLSDPAVEDAQDAVFVTEGGPTNLGRDRRSAANAANAANATGK